MGILKNLKNKSIIITLLSLVLFFFCFNSVFASEGIPLNYDNVDYVLPSFNSITNLDEHFNKNNYIVFHSNQADENFVVLFFSDNDVPVVNRYGTERIQFLLSNGGALYHTDNSNSEWIYYWNRVNESLHCEGYFDVVFSSCDLYMGNELFFQKTSLPLQVIIPEITGAVQIPQMIMEVLKIVLPVGLVLLGIGLVIYLIKLVIYSMK